MAVTGAFIMCAMGDALSIIAQRFAVSVKNLKEWNNLSSNMIRTGQRLIVWVAPTVIKVNSQPTLPTTSLVSPNNKNLHSAAR